MGGCAVVVSNCAALIYSCCGCGHHRACLHMQARCVCFPVHLMLFYHDHDATFRYQGAILDGKRTGRGEYVYADGSRSACTDNAYLKMRFFTEVVVEIDEKIRVS